MYISLTFCLLIRMFLALRVGTENSLFDKTNTVTFLPFGFLCFVFFDNEALVIPEGVNLNVVGLGSRPNKMIEFWSWGLSSSVIAEVDGAEIEG